MREDNYQKVYLLIANESTGSRKVHGAYGEPQLQNKRGNENLKPPPMRVDNP